MPRKKNTQYQNTCAACERLYEKVLFVNESNGYKNPTAAARAWCVANKIKNDFPSGELVAQMKYAISIIESVKNT